ncbi:MAG TPA: hypothetical protein VFU40_02475 [Gemmatimonadales bacterium]|nr:hypothetical protein [Gemmatimonadales bacterium]
MNGGAEREPPTEFQDTTETILRKTLPSLLLIAMIGCDGGPSGPTTGNLFITVAGLPSGTAAAVAVTGPNGYSQSVPATQTLTQLEPGVYTIAASNVSAGATTYAATPQSQTVSVSGSASATVTYSASSPTLGSLLVNINGLPSGSSADVTVTEPGGYNQSVTTTQTLTSLTPGTYTVSARDVVPGGATYTASPPSQNVTVSAGATATANVSHTPPSGGTLDLRIDGLYLTQSTQTYAGTVPLVENRAGFLRVFVVANQINVAAPAVRVRFYQDLVFQKEQTIAAPGASVPTSADESSLGNSWNIQVAASDIRPGLSIVAEVDPSNGVTESDESNNAFQSGSPIAFDVRAVPTVNITFVPVRQRGNGTTGNVSNPSGFLDVVQKMHPLSGVNTAVHAAYTTTTSDTLEDDNGNSAWGTILSELDVLRTAEQSSRYYYGVAKVSYGSGVAGVAYVSTASSREGVALGWDYLPSGSLVAAHELAHSWGRNHAPCGGPGGVDTQYPQADGSIGNYGFDVAAQSLKPPSQADVMGYCDPKWIGAYTYTGVMNYLVPLPLVASSVSAANDEAVQPTLLIWGHIKDGEMVLEPAFQVTTRPKLPRRAGPFSIEARAADGRTLLNLSFEADEVADAPGSHKNFVFAVPLPSATVDRISTLRLSGQGRSAMLSTAALPGTPGPQRTAAARTDSVAVRRVASDRVRLRWNARATPMIMVRDAGTGDVLSLARGGDVTLFATRDDIELVLSDGVRSRTKRVSAR